MFKICTRVRTSTPARVCSGGLGWLPVPKAALCWDPRTSPMDLPPSMESFIGDADKKEAKETGPKGLSQGTIHCPIPQNIPSSPSVERAQALPLLQKIASTTGSQQPSSAHPIPSATTEPQPSQGPFLVSARAKPDIKSST